MSVANTFERQMLDLINEERTSRGIDPLTLELRLNEASEDHSIWMDDARVFSHTGQGGSDPGDRMRDAGFVFSGSWTWGENIAYQSERGAPGIADDVVNLHESLMNSPGHRANILNPSFEVIGIGIEVGDNRGFDAVYVTQNFARTGAQVQLDQPGGAPNPPDPSPPATGEQITGNNSANRLEGGRGHDTLVGFGGEDTLSGSGGKDRIEAGSGDDRVFGNGGQDTIFGEAGDDLLKGAGGDDHLFGGAGRDRMIGGGGDDHLDGGDGRDVMTGGDGADLFIFSQDRDVVADFDPNQDGDRIDLSDVATITGFQDLMTGGHIRQAGDNTHIKDLNGNTMILRDVDMTDLQANDFLF
ncbi:MAG: CAP domain-containing protein [Pseudomonadota bacterium]